MERKYPYNHENRETEGYKPIHAAYAPPEFMGLLKKERDERKMDGTLGAPKVGGDEENV